MAVVLLALCASAAAHAAMPLDDWRNALADLRVKAENDAPQAYLDAQLLQKDTPSGAMLADRARMLNLLSRIELHLALIPESVGHSAEAMAVARQANDADGKIEADLNIALGAINQGRLDDMIAATQDGMSLLENIQNDDLRAEMMFQAAMMYLRFGQFEETTMVAMQALEVARNSSNPRVRAYAEQSMGVAYTQSGRYADAREHYLNMLQAARQSHYSLLEAAAILGLSSVAQGMGDNKESERLVKEAIELFRRVGAPFYLSHAQHQLAYKHVGNKQPEKALPLLDDNAKIYVEHDNPIGLWWTLQMRSQALLAMGRLEHARKDAARAYALAQKLGFNIYLGGSAQRLAEVIAAQGDHKEAYRWAAEAAALKEKSDREKSGKRILDQAKRFQEESKQREIDELSRHAERQHAQQRQMQIGLAAMISLLGVTVFFLLRLRRSREEIRSLNVGLEQRVLERTAELLESRQSLAEAQRIAQVGSWENNLVDNVLTWSEEVYRIFEIDPQQFGASYEAFMEAVHPDDRGVLDSAFNASLENREPFEIEHRLLLPDGRIKYVHEHCETNYDADGRPLRSIGTVQDITVRKEMENALRESRQMLTEAQRIAQVGSWELDHVSNKLTWSDESYRIFEIEPQQFGGNYGAFLDTVHLEDRDKVHRIFQASLDNRAPYEIEHRLSFPDGRIKYVHEHCETSYSADGRPLRSIGTVQDITERKEMENALLESRQLLTEAQRIAQVGSWEYDIASDTHTWSEELFRIYEIDPVKDGASYEGCLNATHPDDRDAITRAYLDSVETGQPYESEHRLLMADGRIKHVHERCETICGVDGTLLRSVGMMQDITERKLAERKLKEALEFSESIINAIPDILFELDRDGRYLNVWTQNPELLAAQKNALLGKTVHEVLSPENAAASMEAIREADEKGFAQGSDIGIDLPQGRRWFSHTLSKKPCGETGAPTFLALSRDITERKQLEEALAARERELRALAESSPGMMGSFYLRPDGTICMPYVSPNIYELFGLHPEDVAEDASPLMRLSHPNDAQRVRDAIAESARTMTPWHCEYRIEHPLKGERWMEGNTNPMPHPDGGVVWYGYVHDITERKLAERKLKETLEFSESVVNAIPDLLFEMDGHGRYLNIWTHSPELLAAQKEILLGNTVNDMLGPESAAAVMESLREAEEKGVSFGKTIALDLPNGMSWFELSVSRKTEGTFLMLSRDISGRKRLEAELLASRNFLDSVIDAVPDPIFVKDRQHRWKLLNDAFCTFIGHPREVLLDKSDYEFFPKEQADVFWEKDERVFGSGEVNLNEESFTSADGEEHFIQTKKTPFVSAEGSQMLVGVIRDITDRKQYEAAREAALAEARRLADLRSEFIAHMSHELRTPLNGILGYAQMLGRDGKLDEKQHASMDVIRQSGEHLLALIDDILDLARIESGRLELDMSDIPLARFLNVVAGIVGLRARQKQLEFVCEFAPDLPEGIRGDEKRLRQVLLNLLSNAVKFTDRGKVTLSVSRVTPSRLAFAVKDTGIGIDSSERETIFQSFEQVSDARHRQGGTGLGLSISRQLVRLMGGDIAVESRPGEGSTFRFELNLPEIEIKPQLLVVVPDDARQAESEYAVEPVQPLVTPPQDEIRELHRLALLGNMRDIANYAERMASQAPRYRSFAEHLKRLAKSYQSKAILAFVEVHLLQQDTLGGDTDAKQDSTIDPDKGDVI
jgi:PAS domain S-box-containing protein